MKQVIQVEKKKNNVCKLFGHKWIVQGFPYSNEKLCKRCGRHERN